jgi:hypothetical protein
VIKIKLHFVVEIVASFAVFYLSFEGVFVELSKSLLK